MPLSVQRTQTIIEKCLAVYLEDRCRRHDERVGGSRAEPSSSSSAKRPDIAVPTPPAENNVTRPMAAPTRTTSKPATLLQDAPLSTSPPDAPESFGSAPSAVIRDFDDFDLFAGTRLDTPPPPGSSSTPVTGSLQSLRWHANLYLLSLPGNLHRLPCHQMQRGECRHHRYDKAQLRPLLSTESDNQDRNRVRVSHLKKLNNASVTTALKRSFAHWKITWLPRSAIIIA